jgi:putative flippase GtrA
MLEHNRFIKRIIGNRINQQQMDKVIQFAKFCMVGIANTVVSLIVYYIIIFINNEWYIIGNLTGFLAGVSN